MAPSNAARQTDLSGDIISKQPYSVIPAKLKGTPYPIGFPGERTRQIWAANRKLRSFVLCVLSLGRKPDVQGCYGVRWTSIHMVGAQCQFRVSPVDRHLPQAIGSGFRCHDELLSGNASLMECSPQNDRLSWRRQKWQLRRRSSTSGGAKGSGFCDPGAGYRKNA